MQADHILSRDENAVRILTINRPQQLNALNNEVLDQLDAQIDAVFADGSLRAVVITGAGERAFVAGADIRELQDLRPAEARELSGRVQQIFQRLRELPVPVIAAVNGYALGGGLELALACDFIYASESAILGLVETDVGLIPGYGGVGRLCQRIGENRAREAIYTSQKFTAAEGLVVGLVNRVFPPDQLLPSAIDTAQSIASKSRSSIRSLKELFEITQGGRNQATPTIEQAAFGYVFTDSDAAEGMSAFVEKRTPQFRE